MAPFLILGALTLGAGWSIARRETSPSLTLMTLPFALLFLVVSVPIAASSTIKSFQVIAESGKGGVDVALETARTMVKQLVFGAVGALLTLAVALAVDVRRRFQRPIDTPFRTTDGATVSWVGWMFGLPVLAMLPASALFWYLSGLPDLLVEAAGVTQFEPGTTSSQVVADWSNRISARLIVGVGGGLLLSVVVAALAAFNGVAAGRSAIPPQLSRFGRILIAAFGLTLVAHLVLLVNK